MKFSVMKFLVAFVMVSNAFVSVARAADIPKEVRRMPEAVFAPQGFDDNDNAEVVIAGAFPNSCFKIGPVRTKVDKAFKTIRVIATAYSFPTGWCLQVRVPYVQTIELGMLSAGKYSVQVERDDGALIRMSDLPVHPASAPSQDDFIYAPVQDALVEDSTLVLRGSFGNNCMRIADVHLTLSAPNVLEVLPVVAIDGGPTCQDIPLSFEKRVALPPLKQGKTLIHVRAMGGQAVNRIVDTP